VRQAPQVRALDSSRVARQREGIQERACWWRDRAPGRPVSLLEPDTQPARSRVLLVSVPAGAFEKAFDAPPLAPSNRYLFTGLNLNKDGLSGEVQRKSWTNAEASFTI